MTLIVGDYTTSKLHNKFHIERKSLIDLYGSITKGHLRFKKEIIRAKHYGISMIVMVEGTKKDFENRLFYRGDERQVQGDTLIKIVDSITRKHGLEFKWYKDRAACQRAAKRMLDKYRHKK